MYYFLSSFFSYRCLVLPITCQARMFTSGGTVRLPTTACRGGRCTTDAVLSEVEASGLHGRELVDMQEEELGDVLQLSGAHVRSPHHLLSIRWAPASAGPHAEEAHRSSAVRFEERFQLFMDAVCWRCAYANYACGCELGEENPAFEVLRNYAMQYHRWREIAASPRSWSLAGVRLRYQSSSVVSSSLSSSL